MAGLLPAPELIERALSSATKRAVVIVNELSEADLRFANSTTTTNGTRRDRKVSVVSFDERSSGVAVGIASASGSVAIEDLIKHAEAKAQAGEVADDAADPVAPSIDADFGLPPAETELEQLSQLAADLGEAFARARSSGYGLFGYAEQRLETTYLASSSGLRRRHVQPTGSFELVGRADGGARSSWAAVGTEDLGTVSVPLLEERLLSRLSWAKRRIDLPVGRYEVLLPPDAVADLVIELWAAMSGRNAEDGGNVFSGSGGSTRLNEQLFEQPFELSSDPNEPGISCAPFLASPSSGADVSVFDNGMELARERYITDGRLSTLRYHRAGAKRSGQAFAAPIDNLVLSLPGATANLDELVARTERGLLLTCLWYIREVDPKTLLLTGLTRDGVYLVEHGEVVGAVNNFRFNESPLDMLGKVLEAGSSERALSREWGEWMNRTSMPALRVADFNMSSVSQAS